MQTFEMKRVAKLIKRALLPAACAAVLGGCATYEATEPPVAASASLPSPAALQNYHAVRATDIVGKTARNQNGEYLGVVQDLVLQMGTGVVRYAVVSSGPGSSYYALPVHSMRAGGANDVVIDLARPRLTDHRAFTAWPDMHDAAYWNELDRISGFQPVQAGHGYDRLSELRGKLVVGARGEHLGRVEDLVINGANDAIHYAIVALDAGRPGGGRLVAVPLHGFAYPREGVNRLALRIDANRLAQLETFDAARWAHLNDPTYLVHMDRYFVSAFPAAGAASFEQLDTNRDGFLSRAELAPTQLAGTDRYALTGQPRQASTFRALDRDGDGFLNRNEAETVVSGASFARMDANGDGFLSPAEAGSLAGGSVAQAGGLTFEQLDRDHDGFVSRAEAGALIAPVAVTTTREVVARPVVTFDTLDVDRDGYLNRAEAASLLERTGGPAMFQRFDSNADGFLSRVEVDTLLRQHSVGGTAGQGAQGSTGSVR